MTFMDTRNRGAQGTRIANIPIELQEVIQPWGYSLTPQDSDYLYQTVDLVQLKANSYKSQRAAYNRFLRAHRIRVAPYQILDRDGCLALFHRWAHQKEEIPLPQIGVHAEIAHLMMREAESAHRVVLQEYRELGLTGRVVWVDGLIRAYTFGYPRSREVFCVLLEVADRSVDGLANINSENSVGKINTILSSILWVIQGFPVWRESNMHTAPVNWSQTISPNQHNEGQEKKLGLRPHKSCPLVNYTRIMG